MESKFNVGDRVKCNLLHVGQPVIAIGTITRIDGHWLIIDNNLVVHEDTAAKKEEE